MHWALTPLITNHFRFKENIYAYLILHHLGNLPITNYNPGVQCLTDPKMSLVTDILPHFVTHLNIAETYPTPFST